VADQSWDLLDHLLGPVVRWARSRSRVGLAIIGSLPGRDAEAWAAPRLLPLGVPTDAPDPRQADLLVVVGRVSHKLAPFVVRTHAAMARPTSVLAVELEPATARDGVVVPRVYPTVSNIVEIVPVDVVLRGLPPSRVAMDRALAALDERLPGVAP
jgi:NADH-quinone oxidoreductase subunit B